MKKTTNSQQIVTSQSLDEILKKVNEQWTLIGIDEASRGREMFKTWLDEVGWKMAIVSLMKLSETDPKSFLQMFNNMAEYAIPKTTRKDNDNRSGLSVSFTMPSIDTEKVKNVLDTPMQRTIHEPISNMPPITIELQEYRDKRTTRHDKTYDMEIQNVAPPASQQQSA